ncbi:MAG: hypothetical protein E6K32_09420, partial [Gammaproteobacteria bacterium]
PPKAAPKKKAAARKAAASKPPAKKPAPKATAKPAAPSPKPSPSPIPPSKAPSTAPSRSIPTPSAALPTDAGGGTRYLSVADLVELHRAVSVEFGGNQAHPGVVESQFGLLNAVQRPQVTMLGREAYATFPDKVAAFLFALLINSPFKGGNRRVALASLFAFCELNNRTVDSRLLDEKAAETLFKRAAGHRELGIPPENVFREIRETMTRAIMPL